LSECENTEAERRVAGDGRTFILVPVTDAICFHAQQCGEKYLKPFRKTQNIAELIEFCAEIDGDFQKLEEIIDHE